MSKTKRKPISKKIRFEVFKRDKFKCQYCGASAPDVVLEIDHVKPVSKGGDNDILNLVTSCHSCNNGKRDKELNDNSAIEKQRLQLEELSEKRNQLQMMIEWRDGLKSVETDHIFVITEAIEAEANCNLNENGERNVKKWLKKFSVSLLLECVDLASEQYLKFKSDNNVTDESFEKFFRMIPRIAYHKHNQTVIAQNVYKDAFYARGILRNRLRYLNEVDCIRLLKNAIDLGIDPQDLFDLCKQVKNWTSFVEEMAYMLGEDDA